MHLLSPYFNAECHLWESLYVANKDDHSMLNTIIAYGGIHWKIVEVDETVCMVRMIPVWVDHLVVE